MNRGLDLGYSYRQQRPVLGLVLERLPATLLLAPIGGSHPAPGLELSLAGSIVSAESSSAEIAAVIPAESSPKTDRQIVF